MVFCLARKGEGHGFTSVIVKGQLSRRAIGKSLRALAAAVLLFSVPMARADRRTYSVTSLDFPRKSVPAGCRVHPVNLLGDGRLELLVVDGENAVLYQLSERSYSQVQEISLPLPSGDDGKVFYGFARLEPGAPHSLVVMTSGGILHYPRAGDRLANEPAMLLAEEPIRGAASGARVQHFDFALDLDGDGLDELFVPQPNSFQIYRQNPPGAFAKVKLPRNPYSEQKMFQFESLLPADPYRVPTASALLVNQRGVDNLLLFDVNADGKQDFIFWETVPGPESREVERYEVFLQRDNMQFRDSPDQVIEIPYEPNADVTFRDLNRDGLLDAIMIQSNLDFVTPRTVVKFFIAQSAKQRAFARETERFVTKDPVGIVRIADFNGDGYDDFALTYFSYQFGSAEDIVDIVVASKLRFKLQFYLWRPQGEMPRAPDHEKELQVNMKAESYSGYPPLYVVDDMDGDGLMDLVVRPDEGKLEVYASAGTLDFRRQPSAEINVSPDAVITFEDLDGDGLNDMLIYSKSRQSLGLYLSSPKK